jgi:ketosteroid isomerase-like protein
MFKGRPYPLPHLDRAGVHRNRPQQVQRLRPSRHVRPLWRLAEQLTQVGRSPNRPPTLIQDRNLSIVQRDLDDAVSVGYRSLLARFGDPIGTLSRFAKHGEPTQSAVVLLRLVARRPSRPSQRDTCRAMSQESVELIREGFARWNEGDYDFILNSAATDIEIFSRFGSLTGEPYRGRRGVREWLAEIQQGFERFDLWLDEARDLGDDVLAIGGISFRARGSGIDMKERMGWVFEFREGRVARMRFYAPPTDALEAVGLRE